MKQQRVLHVIPSVSDKRGGPSFVLRKMTDALAHQGFSIDVATTNDDGRELSQTALGVPLKTNGNVTYFYFPRQTYIYQFSMPLALWLYRNVANYDLVHIHAVFAFPTLIAAIIARWRGIPYIIRPLGILNTWGMTQRRPLLKRVSFFLMESRILRSAAAVHLTSQLELTEVSLLDKSTARRATQPGYASKSVVIPEPAELTFQNGNGAEGNDEWPEFQDKRIVLYFSRIDRKKGLDLLLPAYAAVLKHNPDLLLVIAGNGEKSFIDELKGIADQLGISKQVMWLGFIRGQRKLSLLRRADIFVLPSYGENFGVAVLEAMASGTPVIITDRVGLHDTISDQDAGLVIPCEVPALVDALTRVLGDAELRARVTANALRLVRTTYSEKTVTLQLVQLYGKCCADARAAL